MTHKGVLGYNMTNFIGQFEALLSVNKTRFFFVGADCAHFFTTRGYTMNKKTRFLVHSALIAALYTALTYLQNLLLPGSASWAIQFRASEAMCVLALYTPAAIPGLSIGCLLFNLSFSGALPLDPILGTAATVLATSGMYLTRRFTLKGYPLLAMLLPALSNAVLVGWELSIYIGGGFWINALYVAIGEAAVLLTLGSALFYTIKKRNLTNFL